MKRKNNKYIIFFIIFFIIINTTAGIFAAISECETLCGSSCCSSPIENLPDNNYTKTLSKECKCCLSENVKTEQIEQVLYHQKISKTEINLNKICISSSNNESLTTNLLTSFNYQTSKKFILNSILRI